MFFLQKDPTIVVEANKIMKSEIFISFCEHIGENALLSLRQLIMKDRAGPKKVRITSFEKLDTIPVAKSQPHFYNFRS